MIPVAEKQVRQPAVAREPQFVMVRANKKVLLVDNSLAGPIGELDRSAISIISLLVEHDEQPLERKDLRSQRPVCFGSGDASRGVACSDDW